MLANNAETAQIFISSNGNRCFLINIDFSFEMMKFSWIFLSLSNDSFRTNAYCFFDWIGFADDDEYDYFSYIIEPHSYRICMLRHTKRAMQFPIHLISRSVYIHQSFDGQLIHPFHMVFRPVHVTCQTFQYLMKRKKEQKQNSIATHTYLSIGSLKYFTNSCFAQIFRIKSHCKSIDHMKWEEFWSWAFFGQQ